MSQKIEYDPCETGSGVSPCWFAGVYPNDAVISRMSDIALLWRDGVNGTVKTYRLVTGYPDLKREVRALQKAGKSIAEIQMIVNGVVSELVLEQEQALFDLKKRQPRLS